MPHNTNITDVNPPYGGYPRVVEAGWNDNYLPIWMQEAGYNTYYTGKLWNSHSVTNYNKPLAKGFNGSDFLLVEAKELAQAQYGSDDPYRPVNSGTQARLYR